MRNLESESSRWLGHIYSAEAPEVVNNLLDSNFALQAAERVVRDARQVVFSPEETRELQRRFRSDQSAGLQEKYVTTAEQVDEYERYENA